VSAGNHQGYGRHARFRQSLAGSSVHFVLKQHGMDVAFKVIDTYQGFVQRKRQGFAVNQPHHQRANQARALGDGNRIHIVQTYIGLTTGFVYNRLDSTQMFP
jgi:hypothetical protein